MLCPRLKGHYHGFPFIKFYLKCHDILMMLVCVCVCVNSYADPSPGRYAGSHYLVLLYISAYMNHYFPTNLEPRHGLWWPMCLVLCSAARWRAALKPLRCLCEVQYCA